MIRSGLLALLIVTGLLAYSEPTLAHMSRKCAQAIATHSTVIALWAATAPVGELRNRLETNEPLPENIMSVGKLLLRHCVYHDRQTPKTKDKK